MSATIDKHNLLDEEASPRMVFVGGSNVAFDLDSEKIGHSLGYHPVNMGLKVSLGLGFMLDEVEPALRPGDVVVLFPEYDLFYGVVAAERAETIFTILEVRPGNVSYLDSETVRHVLSNGYTVAGKVLTDLIDHKPYVEDSNNPIRRGAFNRYGDNVVHLSQPPRTFVIGQIETAPASIDWAIDRLNRFHERCRRKGVRLFFAFPPTLRLWCDLNNRGVRAIANAVNFRLKFAIVDTPREMCLPIEDFYDTQYHLNESGIKKHAKLLIDGLRKAGVQETASAPASQQGTSKNQ